MHLKCICTDLDAPPRPSMVEKAMMMAYTLHDDTLHDDGVHTHKHTHTHFIMIHFMMMAYTLHDDTLHDDKRTHFMMIHFMMMAYTHTHTYTHTSANECLCVRLGQQDQPTIGLARTVYKYTYIYICVCVYICTICGRIHDKIASLQNTPYIHHIYTPYIYVYIYIYIYIYIFFIYIFIYLYGFGQLNNMLPSSVFPKFSHTSSIAFVGLRISILHNTGTAHYTTVKAVFKCA